MKKEQFKEFVKNNPKLIKFVKNNDMTWQKFYEMYDLYGESEEAWKEYIINEEPKEEIVNTGVKSSVAGLTLSEVVNWFKNVDLDGLQEGIGSVQRVLGVMQDLTQKKIQPQNQRINQDLFISILRINDIRCSI